MRFASFAAALMATAALSACATGGGGGMTEAPEISAANLNEHIRTLSDDSFMGRGIATEGETKTVAYLSEQFAEAGFEPGGVNGGWTQPVTLNRFAASNVTGQFQAGDWSQPVTQGQEVAFSTRLPGQSVNLQDVPLVFVGYGIDAPERQWNDFKDVDVRGKVIVVLINDADFEDPSMDVFGGKAMTYYGRWTYKYEEAARKGAAGVLVVHETEPASYGWTTVANSWGVPQFDIERANAAAERVPLEGWIQRDLAVDLFQRGGQDFEALKAQARSRDFRPVELTGVTLDANFDVSTSSIQTSNVIARLPGSTQPDETILYTAHWDHIGVGEPDAEGDRIFNGAVDNATGTSALIELARVYAAGPRPERSIVLIGFTAEESGLLGSEYYAANPVYPLETTVAGFNLDGMGVYGGFNELSVVGFGQSELDERLERAAATQGRSIAPDARPEAGSYYRSDHFPLVKRGVPMAYAEGGVTFRDDADGARQARADEYGRIRYHQAADEWSPDWDLTGMVEDIEIAWRVGNELANSRDWPGWKPGSEFRDVRLRSDAQRR